MDDVKMGEISATLSHFELISVVRLTGNCPLQYTNPQFVHLPIGHHPYQISEGSIPDRRIRYSLHH